MAEFATARACSSSPFLAALQGSTKHVISFSIPCISNRTQLCCALVPLLYPSESLSHRRRAPVQVAAAGCYPKSMAWWKKGGPPNMREIYSTEEFLDALSKAEDKLVLVDFYNVNCRSCKAMYPKICQIAAENPDIEVFTVNFYENNALCRSLNVKILPFFHFYRGAEGRLDAFSCSLSKVNKLREAVAKHKVNCPQRSPVAVQNTISWSHSQRMDLPFEY